jgi:diguanylate cyclase
MTVGGVEGTLGSASSDAGQQALMAQTFAEKEELFLSAMASAQLGIFVLQDKVFKYANPHFLKLFGYTAEELLDRQGLCDLLVAGQHVLAFEQLSDGGAEIAGEDCELTAISKDGKRFPLLLSGTPTVLGGRPAVVGTVLDISVQKSAERRIRELADFDALTGLPNRRLLQARFSQLVATAVCDESEIALVFLDLDHFKRVNDSLGHSIGDVMLCEVARRLLGAVRHVDTLARLGGDEFIIAMPGISAAAAIEVARRLLEVCVLPYVVAGHELTVTPSLGISVFPQDGADLETLLKNADAAMYRAKEGGRNAFQFYASEMNTATLDRLLMESNLRRALQQNEFTLYYQPLIDLQNGQIIGVEALIRWIHPDLGMIMPDRFIHVAEETGLINGIGNWVLCEACRQAQDWNDAGLPALRMAVNVAPVQSRQAGFVDVVAGALAASGLEASCLELEVTERTVMHDAEIHLGTLSALQQMGVELSLDDFGTGYSSLAYLKRFPVGKLKIDRSFVNDLDSDVDDRAIATTIVSMGRNLRLTVLAEGVETEQQLDLLRKMGCDMAQGYYFSRAVPADQMARLLAEQPF